MRNAEFRECGRSTARLPTSAFRIRTSENPRMAFLEEDDAILDAEFEGARDESFRRLIDRLQPKRETAVVHRHQPLRLQFLEGLHRLLGIHVHRATGRRGVGANRQERDLDRATLADFAEALEIRGVAAMKDGTFALADDKAAEAAVRICQ